MRLTGGMADDALHAARQSIVDAGARLVERGFVLGSSGNVSVRVDSGRVLATPTGVALDALTPEALPLLELDGHQVSGPLAPTSEVSLHLAIYRQTSTAGAVVHTHAPYATALSCVVDELPLVHYEMLLLGGAIRVAPFAAFGTDELADLALTALDGKTAALLANHGTVAHGADLAAAMKATELLEWSAAVYTRAAAVATPRALTAEQAEATIASALRHRYGQPQPAAVDL